eukprot:TRINITY_DN2111_c0_g1_i1.p1 TRINITY_DN2111_c0_g1~~TRINITY_DN2111_c0_g1_i1.p1  ORF type:complete len:849 (+),score=172.53 TRINITY_DN2111_c0_g1_i1:366-2912(+)
MGDRPRRERKKPNFYQPQIGKSVVETKQSKISCEAQSKGTQSTMSKMQSETIQRVKSRGNSLVRELQNLQMEDTYLSRLGFGEDRHVLRSNRSPIDRIIKKPVITINNDDKKEDKPKNVEKDAPVKPEAVQEQNSQPQQVQQSPQQSQQQPSHQQQKQQSTSNNSNKQPQYQQQQQIQQQLFNKNTTSVTKEVSPQKSVRNKRKTSNILDDNDDENNDNDEQDIKANQDVKITIKQVTKNKVAKTRLKNKKQGGEEDKGVQENEGDKMVVEEDEEEEEDDVSKDSDFETTSLKRKILKAVYLEDDMSEDKVSNGGDRTRRKVKDDKETQRVIVSSDSQAVGISISVSSTTNGTSATDQGDEGAGGGGSKRGRRKINALPIVAKSLEDFYNQQHIMVKNAGDGFYYRARILKQVDDRIQLQFTGFAFAPFWLTKNSGRIWMGSNSKKDWSYQRRTGCWLPKKHARESYREIFLGGRKQTVQEEDQLEQEVQGPQVGRPRKKMKVELQQDLSQGQVKGGHTASSQTVRDPPVRSIAVPSRNSAPPTRPIVQESGNEVNTAAFITTCVSTHNQGTSSSNVQTTLSNSAQPLLHPPRKRSITEECAQPPKKRREFLYGVKQIEEGEEEGVEPKGQGQGQDNEGEQQTWMEEKMNVDQMSLSKETEQDNTMDIDQQIGSSRGSGGSDDLERPLRQSRRTRKPTQKILESSKQQKAVTEEAVHETRGRGSRQKSWSHPQHVKHDVKMLSSASNSSKSLLGNGPGEELQFKVLKLMMSRQQEQFQRSGENQSGGQKTPEQQIIGSKIWASFNSFKQELNLQGNSKHQSPSSNQSAQTETQVKGIVNKPSPIPLFK